MAINTTMSGADIDRALKSFFDMMTSDNNDKLLYIRNGELSVEDGEILFNVVSI